MKNTSNERKFNTSHAGGFAQGQSDFGLLINSIRDYAIFMMDPTGIIKTWNPGAENIKGYTASDVIGKHFSLFYSQEDRDIGHPAKELNIAASVGRYEEEGWRIKKDGSKFWANVIITRLTDESGKIIGFSKVTRDLTERMKSELALRESEERFRLMVENVKDYAILMLDPEGHVQSWNEGAERIKGWKPNEIIGRHFSLFYPIEDVKAGKPEWELRTAISDGRFEDTGLRVRKDGSFFWANVVITCLKDEKGKVRGYSKVTRDITEKVKAEETLKKAYTDLEKRVLDRTTALSMANKELESFSYSVSHDLRAPLRSMDGFSLALLNLYGNKLDDKGQEYLKRIRESSQKMGQLIEDIINLSRIGRAEITKKEIDFTLLARSVCEKFQSENPQRDVTLKIAEGMRGFADENLLRIVLENLIGNSFKYSGHKKNTVIEIGSSQKNEKVVYYIKDNGAGFDMSYADKLFQPFQRLHSDKEFPGTGIGLASVKRVLNRHDGSIWAIGAIDEGATFYFTLAGENNE